MTPQCHPMRVDRADESRFLIFVVQSICMEAAEVLLSSRTTMGTVQLLLDGAAGRSSSTCHATPPFYCNYFSNPIEKLTLSLMPTSVNNC